jgi:nucleotide-binding universal stress UspA family protein
MFKKALITKILVPVDGSKPSIEAAKLALDLAKERKAKVIALHAIRMSFAFPPESKSKAQIPPKEEVKAAESYVSNVRKMGKRVGVDVETKVVESCPSVVDTICDFARNEKCDLIVMGTRGRAGIGHFRLGGVATGVVTYAPCTVVVVR